MRDGPAPARLPPVRYKGDMTRLLALPFLLLAACATTGASDPWPATYALSGGPTDERPAIPVVSKPNTLRGMVGYTTSRGDGSFTLAGQYEYRWRKDMGFGGFLDLSFGDEFSPVLGGAFFWHPIDIVNLMAGPGYDFEEHEVVVRVGGSVDFEWRDFEIGPAIFVDLGGHGTPLLLSFSISRDF